MLAFRGSSGLPKARLVALWKALKKLLDHNDSGATQKVFDDFA